MKYIHIGTDNLSNDLFQDIKNNNLKPYGGLWASLEYNTNYNAWAEYLTTHKVFFKTRYNKNEIPLSLITLKPNIRLYVIDSKKSLDYLKEKYPFNDFIDYKKLALDYDAIFIDMTNINLREFSITTLLILNLDIIDYYQKGVLNIHNIVDDYHTHSSYNTDIDNKDYKVTTIDSNYKDIICFMREFIISNKILEYSYDNEQIVLDYFKEHLTKYNETEQKLLVRKTYLKL